MIVRAQLQDCAQFAMSFGAFAFSTEMNGPHCPGRAHPGHTVAHPAVGAFPALGVWGHTVSPGDRATPLRAEHLVVLAAWNSQNGRGQQAVEEAAQHAE